MKNKDDQAEMYVKIQKFFKSIRQTNPEHPGKVLVHCAMGMSRSATSVIMFLMRLFKCNFDDAFEFVKTQRQATDPNEGFIEQLKKFEEQKFEFLAEEATINGISAVRENE